MALKPFETLSRSYRNLQRTQEIINVFIKHGFGDWWSRVKTDGRVKALLEKVASQPVRNQRPIPAAKRMRLALEELGPTFVKMGQILSTRPDLIPTAYVEEFTHLQSRVPPLKFMDIKRVVQTELGMKLDAAFVQLIVSPWDRHPWARSTEQSCTAVRRWRLRCSVPELRAACGSPSQSAGRARSLPAV